MKIIDLNGKEIEVTDLKLAILQADDYRHYRHIDKAFAEFDRQQSKYWEDIYFELLILKNGQLG